MTRKEMIDWIEDHWNNTAERGNWLYNYLTELGLDIEDDSDEEEGFYANLTDDDLKMVIDELGPNTKPTVKELINKIKDTLKPLGRISDIDNVFSSSEAIFDLSIKGGDTFRIQIHRM